MPDKIHGLFLATRWLFLVALVGCAGTETTVLDQQTRELIRQEWVRSVADGDTFLPDLAVAAPKPGDARAARRPPSTLNPAAPDLPAEVGRPITGDDAVNATPSFVAGEHESAPPFDLSDLLRYSVAHGPQYRTSKEDLFIASLNLLAENHLWGPRFFSTLTAGFVGTPEGGDHDQAARIVQEFRVSRRLYHGGEVSVRALVNFVTLLRDSGGSISEGQDAAVIFGGRIPLLRGAGVVAREDLIQAERNLIYAARGFERFRREFLLDIATRYYDLLRQDAQTRNLERQVANLTWLADRIEALAAAGRQPHFEVQRALQQVLFARNNLFNARESYQTQIDSFKLQIGMPMLEPLRVVPREVVIPEPELDGGRAVLLAFDHRLDLQTLRDRIADADRRLHLAKNDLLPDLDLRAELALRTDADKQHGGVDFELADSAYRVEAVFDAPLDRQVEQVRYRRAMIDVERANRNYRLAEDRIAQEVRRSMRQIEQARFTLALQERNIDNASKRLRGVVLRLRSLGPRDFIEAQDDLLQAQNRRDAALRDLRVSILRYLLDTGQMRVNAEGQWLPPGRLADVSKGTDVPSAERMMKSDEGPEPLELEKIAEEGDRTPPSGGGTR